MNTIENSNNHGATGNGAPVSVNEATTPPSITPVVPARSVKAATNFVNIDTNAQFIVDSGRILKSMTHNQAFPDPDPDLDTLSAARNAYIAAVSLGQDSTIGRSKRNQLRQSLVVLLRRLAHYVEDTSAGDRVTLLSSGFYAQRSRKPVGPMPVPGNVRLVRGKLSGQAIARCEKVEHASAYQWRLAPANTPTAWLPAVTTFGARTLFEGLEPLTNYVAQVCAVGTSGAGDWSDAAMVLVL